MRIGSMRTGVMRIRTGASAAALLAATLAFAAQAQTPPPDAPPPDGPPGEHGGGPGMHHGGPGMMMPGMEGHMLMRMADELGLSTEQRQTIRGFFESAKPGFQKLHEQMHANMRQILDTQPDDPNYQSVVQRVSQSSAELASQMVLQSSQLRTQVYGVLTADQKAKLKAKQAEMRARWEQRAAQRGAAKGAPAAPR